MVVDGRETGRTMAAFHGFVQRCAPGLPLPGAGDTWRRFEALADVSAEDLSAGRLAEGHADALAILAEAGRGPAVEGATYGVWAARRPSGGMTARRVGAGWELHGVQEFCSGANLLDRALVAADGPEGQLLFDLSVAESVVTRHAGSWPAVGMAASDSMTLTISGAVGERDRVGGPGFYTGRRGFWLGAVGVAACWFGGARGLVDGLVATLRSDPGPHAAAALGRCRRRPRRHGGGVAGRSRRHRRPGSRVRIAVGPARHGSGRRTGRATACPVRPPDGARPVW